jgi:uncharacterized protein (TIGR02118 family)
MKAILTLGFDGDREPFTEAVLERLADMVQSGGASGAALDVRLSDRELEAFGPALSAKQAERAVITLWDTDAKTALSVALPRGSTVVGAYRVQEVIEKDYERDWPSMTRSPGFKMIAFLHRRQGLSHADFSSHWRERHGPLAVARQPGFWRYVQNHVIDPLSERSTPWDGVGEIHFRTMDDALTRSYDSEEAQQLIWQDVERFLDYSRSPTLTTHEWLIDSDRGP